MKEQLMSLFMVLLLIGATIPVFADSDREDDDRYEDDDDDDSDRETEKKEDNINRPSNVELKEFWLQMGESREVNSNLFLRYVGPSQKPYQIACTEELKLCSDGNTYVSRNPVLGCAFNACPGEPAPELVDAPQRGACELFEMSYVFSDRNSGNTIDKKLIDKKLAEAKEKLYKRYLEDSGKGRTDLSWEEYYTKYIDTVEHDIFVSAFAVPDRTTPKTETKSFCIIAGEIGYPVILYQKREDGAVLVGYNVWKNDSAPGDDYLFKVNSDSQQKQQPKKDDFCVVEGNGEVPVGTRVNVEGISQYCDPLTKQMLNQKQDGEQAENNYECLSNEARNGQCENSLNFLQKIWKSITSIFGF